jgi:hypothetical protein
MLIRVLRSPDGVDGNAAPSATLSEAAARAAYPWLDSELCACYPSISRLDVAIDDNAMRNILSECSKFLLQLANITSGVLASIDVSAVRGIVAENAPMPGSRPAEAAPDRDHRKNPRGRKHPLITLVQFALQGVRMLLQITAAAHPNLLGKETLEQREARKALEEQERTFNKMLSGKI